MVTPFVVLHIPHSSTVIPAYIRGSLSLSEKDMAGELLLMTDHYTDELFDYPFEPVQRIVFPISRLVLDPERFLDDALEPMAQKGMGVVYTKTSDGKPIRDLNFEPTRAELIRQFYSPHHNKLTIAVEESLRDNRLCLVLDCHSFPLKPFPFEPRDKRTRPDICFGTDSFHTPEWLVIEAERLFRMKGLSVARNYPFKGCLVPDTFYERKASVLALMIEIKRSLYMDEASGEKSPGFSDFKIILSDVLKAFFQSIRDM